MIPKIIHYCWFGGKEIPDNLKKYMSSWRILEDAGYTIIRWDESNCSFSENGFVKNAYSQKRWGFIGDYYRWKALFDYGGIYLDTDVVVKKLFDPLLENKAFIGFMYDDLLGTAIIGSEKGGSFASKMIKMYDEGYYPCHDSVIYGMPEQVLYVDDKWPPSNNVVTWNVIKHYKQFKLNNRCQDLSDVKLFSNYYFDSGRIFGQEYCRHMYTNLWVGNNQNPLKNFIKDKMASVWVLPMYRYYQKQKNQKTCETYEIYLSQKNKHY